MCYCQLKSILNLNKNKWNCEWINYEHIKKCSSKYNFLTFSSTSKWRTHSSAPTRRLNSCSTAARTSATSTAARRRCCWWWWGLGGCRCRRSSPSPRCCWWSSSRGWLGTWRCAWWSSAIPLCTRLPITTSSVWLWATYSCFSLVSVLTFFYQSINNLIIHKHR